jgi:hypothetical protein
MLTPTTFRKACKQRTSETGSRRIGAFQGGPSAPSPPVSSPLRHRTADDRAWACARSQGLGGRHQVGLAALPPATLEMDGPPATRRTPVSGRQVCGGPLFVALSHSRRTAAKMPLVGRNQRSRPAPGARDLLDVSTGLQRVAPCPAPRRSGRRRVDRRATVRFGRAPHPHFGRCTRSAMASPARQGVVLIGGWSWPKPATGTGVLRCSLCNRESSLRILRISTRLTGFGS